MLAKRPGRRRTIDSLVQQRWLQPLADALVAANYWLVLLFLPGLPTTFRLYLGAGGAWWAAAAVRAHSLNVACEFEALADASATGGSDAVRTPLTKSPV